jgi:thiamine biosynthesis protein ThiI
MGLVLLRYGEIALKGENRTYFLRKLRHNVRLCLKANGVEAQVWQEGQRLYLETEQVDRAIEAVQRVFGLVSLSAVQAVPPAMEPIMHAAVATAHRSSLDSTHTFRVTARRADKSFPFPSPEVERQAGAAVAAATGARVDLSNAQVDIGIEIQPTRALIFGETIPGPGGLPLNSQGRVVVLLSGGIDSPVAAWLMMKRGCAVIPVHFSHSQAQTEQVNAIVAILNRYAYGWQLRPILLSHDEVLGPILARLRELHQERWTCLFCKRAMLAKATEIAEQMGASALVTGDSLGQVASQTLSNLEVVSYRLASGSLQKPILRPLIGMDKTEIMALARRIGTYEASIQRAHTCPFVPAHPLTHAQVTKLREMLAQMEQDEDELAAADFAPADRLISNVSS